MQDMQLDLDNGESLTVNVGNVRVHVWRVDDGSLSISTSTRNKGDNIQVEVNTNTGEIRSIKHPVDAKVI